MMCLAICEQEDKRKAFEAIASFGGGIAIMMAAVGTDRDDVDRCVSELCDAIKNDCLRAFDAAQKAAEELQFDELDRFMNRQVLPIQRKFNA